MTRNIKTGPQCFKCRSNLVGQTQHQLSGASVRAIRELHATVQQSMFALMLHHKRSRLLAGGRQLRAAAFLWSVKRTINDQTRWYPGYTQRSSRTQPNNINNKIGALILFYRKQWSEISFCGLLWVLTTVHMVKYHMSLFSRRVYGIIHATCL
jgi:hypothetical protein